MWPHPNTVRARAARRKMRPIWKKLDGQVTRIRSLEIRDPEDILSGYEYQHAIDSCTNALSVKDKSFRRVPVKGM